MLGSRSVSSLSSTPREPRRAHHLVGGGRMLQVHHLGSEQLVAGLVGDADHEMLDFIRRPVAPQFSGYPQGERLGLLKRPAWGCSAVRKRIPVGEMEYEACHVVPWSSWSGHNYLMPS